MSDIQVAHVVKLQNGFPFESTDFGSDGPTPLLRIRDLTAPTFETYLPFTVPEQFTVMPGDLVVGMDGDFNAQIWHREPAALNQRVCRLRAVVGNDIRFIAYALPRELQQINDTQYATTVKHLSSAEILKTKIPSWPLEEQRRIADFLDDRVARIDQIIAGRRQQVALLREHFAAAMEQRLVASLVTVERPLQVLTDPNRPIQYGIVLPGPDFPGGVPIIKGGDIGSGRLDRLELNRTDPEIERAYVRSRVRSGDFVIAIRGSVGEVASVPEGLDLANLTQDSARIAAMNCDPGWLHAVLHAPSVQSAMEERMTGSTVRGINIESLRRVPIPVADASDQKAAAAWYQDASGWQHAHVNALRASIQRLHEYKQSLITAAVTGELDVTTASSRIPE